MRPLIALAIITLLAAGCTAPSDTDSTTTGQSSTHSAPMNQTLTLTSSAFKDGAAIPRAYSCDANQASQVSLPLNITGGPATTVSIALIMQDPDVPVPEAATRTLTHWLVWNITAPAVFGNGTVPAGTVQGANDFGQGYLGPCPPVGSSPHHYNLTAYALDIKLSLASGASRAQLDSAMAGHVLARSKLTGTYARQVL